MEVVSQGPYWGQEHVGHVKSQAVAPLHPGQAGNPQKSLENLGSHCDTAAASQGLGSPAAGSGTPAAAGTGLASAGAWEAGGASHGLLQETWRQTLQLVAPGKAPWVRIFVEAGVFGPGLAQPGRGRTNKQAGTQARGCHKLWDLSEFLPNPTLNEANIERNLKAKTSPYLLSEVAAWLMLET